MLHAFSRKKSQLYKRYLGHREAGEKRVSEEDEITALIMGPLDYLPASVSGAFWRAVVEQRGHANDLLFPAGAPWQVSMRFWPRSIIEPDLLVELVWPDGERRLLLVEFKWRAPLSGKDQLHRQWREFLKPEEQRIAYHLFIAPELSEGLNALGQEDVWRGRLLLRSWFMILQVLRDLRGLDGAGFQRWQPQVVNLLGLLGVRQFQGFEHLHPYPSAPAYPLVFWAPIQGFGDLGPPCFSTDVKQLKPIFWRPGNE